MNFANPKVWVTLLSAVAVGVIVLGDVGRSAPGPLASAHAREAKLNGFGSCSQCHGGFTSSMAESCLECHQDVGAQIENHKGLHGKFDEAQAQQCALCHSDHNGESFAMVNDRSFALAGVAQRKLFDHARIGFEMGGQHLELGCSECHAHADAPVVPEGAKRFLGLTQKCATCHEDAHEGRMRFGCATCHTQQSFETPAAKNHDRHLPLTGGHANLSCRDCHAEKDPHALEKLGGPRTSSRTGSRTSSRTSSRTCADCHTSPHAGSFLAAVAKLKRLPSGAACVACHTPEHTSFQDDTLLVTKELHAASGFRLDAPHDKASCQDCHGEPGEPFAKRHPGRKPDDCRSCHQDPHGGQFAASPLAAQGCVSCHEPTHFEPHAFTVESHAKSGFPLTGKHVETDCNKCHSKPDTGRPRTFLGTSLECESCHGDAHAGFFDSFAKALPRAPGKAPGLAPGRATGSAPGKAPTNPQHGRCASCHGTHSFAKLPEGGFDHSRFARFPIRGAHAQLDCEECHVRAEKPDRFGRTFGRLDQLHGPMKKGGESCTACHRDPHRGSFEGKGQPQVHEERIGCERCHTHTSFRTLREGFDHGKWTGFDLTGAHGKAGCSECHAPLRRPDAHGRTWARAKGRLCADCHADPHAAQFAPNPSFKTDCARCHRPDKNFQDLTFNHEIQSRFPLGERHKGVACARCHRPAKSAGKDVVRYKGTSRECASCHGKQQDPFRRQRGK